MKVLALSGSLRALSINSALLRMAQHVAPPGISVTVCTLLGELPLFNPDLEDAEPDAVARFRAQVATADALLIASPEYAHGVSGTIKNALDWLVSFEPFAGKPVAVLNAAARAHHADVALRETLATMSAPVVDTAPLHLPAMGKNANDSALREHAPLQHELHAAFLALLAQLAPRSATLDGMERVDGVDKALSDSNA